MSLESASFGVRLGRFQFVSTSFSGDAWLGVHLGMSGELTVEPPGHEARKHDHLVLFTAKHALVFADKHCLQRGQQTFAVAGEVFVDGHLASGVDHDGNEVGGRHVFPDEVLGGADGARLIGRRHGGHVEVERSSRRSA